MRYTWGFLLLLLATVSCATDEAKAVWVTSPVPHWSCPIAREPNPPKGQTKKITAWQAEATGQVLDGDSILTGYMAEKTPTGVIPKCVPMSLPGMGMNVASDFPVKYEKIVFPRSFRIPPNGKLIIAIPPEFLQPFGCAITGDEKHHLKPIVAKRDHWVIEGKPGLELLFDCQAYIARK